MYNETCLEPVLNQTSLLPTVVFGNRQVFDLYRLK